MSDVLANPYRTKLKTAHFYYLDKIGGKRPITKKRKIIGRFGHTLPEQKKGDIYIIMYINRFFNLYIA